VQVDKTIPGERWVFDSAVADAFDDMLARSIPQYDVMRKACTDLACRYAQSNTNIIDLGCSRGEAMSPIIDRLGAHNRFIGIEISDPMLEASRKRFENLINADIVIIQKIDLRTEYPAWENSVTLCILTLQFTPIEYRLQIMQDIYDHLLPDGAFIFVEKIMGNSAKLNKDMIDLYYKMKSNNGYSPEQIDRKRLSLEGVLVPMTAKWNEEMLTLVGFRQVDCFWRWMNFAGWIAIK